LVKRSTLLFLFLILSHLISIVLLLRFLFSHPSSLIFLINLSLTHILLQLGAEGVLGEKLSMKIDSPKGKWREAAENVNAMTYEITKMFRAISQVTEAISVGDFSKTISKTFMDKGDIAETKARLNAIVDVVNLVDAEVVRVAREMHAGVRGEPCAAQAVWGAWRELLETVEETSVGIYSNIPSRFFIFIFLL
jgi:HAMP domain